MRSNVTKLPVFTLGDIRSWGPCVDPAKYAPQDWSGDALDVLRARHLDSHRRFWVTLREQALPEPLLSEVVVAVVAETPLHDGRTVRDLLTDPRTVQSLEARLAWGRGWIGDGELAKAEASVRTAARDADLDSALAAALAAARDAALDAAAAVDEDEDWVAARGADWAAARYAAAAADEDEDEDWVAARDAAKAAAQHAQIEIAIRVIEAHLGGERYEL